MPPRNLRRSFSTEAELASRVAYERELRGMTYEGLAKRMTDTGCAINQSGIYKIEKGKPRRRIAVDELVAFAIVFEMPVDRLLLPRWIAEDASAAQLWQTWDRADQEADAARGRADAARADLDLYLKGHPEVMERLTEIVADREAADRG